MTAETDTTMLYYSIDNSCDPELAVTVVAINEVGTGEPTMLQIEPTLKGISNTQHYFLYYVH